MEIHENYIVGESRLCTKIFFAEIATVITILSDHLQIRNIPVFESFALLKIHQPNKAYYVAQGEDVDRCQAKLVNA